MNRKYAIGLLLVISVALLIMCKSEKPVAQPSAKTVEDLAGYSAALDDCRLQGKDAGKYDIYEQCAQKADIKYGKK